MAADFKLDPLSKNVWAITELDDRNLFPINYLIVGTEKALLIDTGIGFSNIYLYAKRLGMVGQRPIIVVNTHNHPEQTGGNWRFSTTGKYGLAQRVEALAASARNKNYTRLLDSTHQWETKTYKVTRWLADEEEILLGDERLPENRVQVFWTPGHTPDSITLWYDHGGRLFLGDLFQRFEDIKFVYEHCNVKQVESSLRKVLQLIKSQRPRELRYSSCRSESDGACWPTFKQFHRFFLSILAGTHPGTALRIDDEEGWRFESRDKSMKVVLSREIFQKLVDARTQLQKAEQKNNEHSL
ncbi:unnamed protein product, partial [Mesorhabditis belari]|uniref:Metallo-beta-lactamase domain-containing protein n=1 Tax=Mesorhabditis belari TaxID=2138241 RepID=A0AAF3FKT7_9BILA